MARLGRFAFTSGRFNESGFGTFEQVPNPKGRPPILRASQLRELIDVALSSPSERGCPPRSAVVCFDEWGPLDLKPIGGVAWARQKQPWRMHATYRHLQGTEQFLGFYDVHADCLGGLFRRRKRVLDISKAFCYLRHCYPRKRLFVILDNLHTSTIIPASLPCCDDSIFIPSGRRRKLPGST